MNMLTELQQTLAREGKVSFSLRVRPNARQTQIVSVMEDDSVKIALAAPAEEGKANAELIRFLSEQFGVHASHVEILAGGSGRRKVVRISA